MSLLKLTVELNKSRSKV